MAALGGRLAGVPTIVGEETAQPTTRRWRGHLYYRLLTMLTHKMVAVSPAVAEYLTRSLFIPPGKVQLVLNGVHEPPAASAGELARVRNQLSLHGDELVIGVVGRLKSPAYDPPDSHQRVADAIDELAILIREIPNARLLVVGDGPDRERLVERAAVQGVGHAAIFAGYQGQTRPFFEVMDVLAHPAGSEAFGLVLVEAMFAGLPVVATNVGGIPSVVEDGRTAFLIPPRRPDLLADRLLQLLRNPAQRIEMGEAGCARARERVGEKRYVEDVAALDENLIASRRRHGSA